MVMRALTSPPTPLPGAALFTVVGQPISHSRSPLIHRLFAEQFGLALQYERLEVSPGSLHDALTALRRLECRGLNVTVPLKAEAFALASRHQPRAARAGVANTLWWDEQEALVADNTDGAGLIADLTVNWKLPLVGANILLLGAGGAAQGVLPALLDATPASISVHNRTAERAIALVTRFRARGTVTLCEKVTTPFDLVVNATSTGIHGEVPALPTGAIASTTRCYDLYYASTETSFLATARQLGAQYRRDGFGMLVEQAAEAFWLWHGIRPNTRQVIQALRPSPASTF